MDKTNKKSNKEIFVDPETNQIKVGEKKNSSKLAGLEDKFPVENFITLTSQQNGREINLQTYKYPSAKPEVKGVVYLLHGLFEHSNSNANIAKSLAKQGYDVLSFDLRGHGKSGGIKGYFENQKLILQDIHNFIEKTESDYKTKNKFVIGYSFGGLYANLICLEKPDYFNGMVLLAPAFYNDNKEYAFLVKIARLLNSFLPSMNLVNIKKKPNDSSIVEYIKNDPLMYKGKLKVGTGLTIIDSINYSNSCIHQVTTPCYIIQGRQDEVVNPIGASNFFDKLPIKDKTLMMLDDLDHFIVRNSKIDFFLHDIAFWMAEHTK